jgi:hypothetical protein
VDYLALVYVIVQCEKMQELHKYGKPNQPLSGHKTTQQLQELRTNFCEFLEILEFTRCDNLIPRIAAVYQVRQTHVPKHVWTCSNLSVHELQTK